jgi:hypothetical protein
MLTAGIDVVLAGTLVVCMLLYASIAKISWPAKAALFLGSVAALVTTLLAVPLVGLGIFMASVVYAAADRQVRVRARRRQ